MNDISSRVSDDLNVSVFKAVLIAFHKHPNTIEANRMMMVKQFILKALGSSKNTEFDHQLWSDVVSFLDTLSSIDENEKFLPPYIDIIDVLSACLEYLPVEMYQSIRQTLAKICKSSEKVAKNVNNHSDGIENALQIFEKSFSGICRFQKLQYIQDVSNSYLVLQDANSRTERQILVDIELSKIICSTLSSSNLAGEAAIELFPSLCKLMNSDDSRLRKESAELMSNVNVSALMKRANAAEAQLQAESELPQVQENLQKEIKRAEIAEKQAGELTQINVHLMREVEQLRAEKAKLEQQVAVLSEGSAYM